VPLIVTIHDMASLRSRGRFGTLKRFYLRIFVPLSARKARRVLAVSEAARKEIADLCKIDGGKIVVVRHGISRSFSPDGDRSGPPAALKLKVGSGYILYVGTLEPGKNIPRIIEAYSIVRKRTGTERALVIAGRTGWLHDDIFRAVKRLGLDKEIVFTGYVSKGDLPSLYRGADLFVFPSLYEGFGLPVLEAMACGTPVVTSNTSSLPEVAGDAALLVDPENVEEIAGAMERVLTDQDLRAELSRRGRERARLFTWERCAQETLKVYEEVYKETR
jgi:glycosyltransferase involved in cell wall biosynthesis